MKIGKVDGASRSARATGAYAVASKEAAPAAPVVPVSAAVLGIPEEEFTPRVRDAITTLMHEVHRLRQEVEAARRNVEDAARYADQDMLLPIMNRRAFVRELTRVISVAQRYGTPSSLIYFDLNDFKTINDTHGHAAGDAVLKGFSETIKAQIRDTDILARVGGDEFAIILSHLTVDQARRKAGDLAARLEANPVRWKDNEIAVRFSYGVYGLRAGENANVAMAEADRAMYEQKRATKTQE